MKGPLGVSQDARLLPGPKVMVNGARAREFAGQQAPRTPGAQQVKDCIEDGTKIGSARPCAGRYGATQVQAAALRSVVTKPFMNGIFTREPK